MKEIKKIGIVDSGIGGLPILDKIRQKYPKCDYIYIGDTVNFPYGNKTVDKVRKYLYRIIDYLVDEGMDLIVVACNSASSTVVDDISKEFEIPIIGSVIPTVNAVVNAGLKKTAVLGTDMAINSNKFTELLSAENIESQGYICNDLVNYIEKNDYKKVIKETEKSLSMIDDSFDSVILGCTHFILIKGFIKQTTDLKVISPDEFLVEELMKYNIYNYEDAPDGTQMIYFTKIQYHIMRNIATKKRVYKLLSI